MGENKNPAADAGTTQSGKPPMFLITLAVVCLAGPFFWVLLLLVKVGLKVFGSTTPQCAEMDFWLSSFNGILLGAAGMAVIPSMVSTGYGAVRMFTKKPWAITAIVMGLVMAPVNMKLAYDTWIWYDGTSKEVVYEGAKDGLRAMARAQKKYQTQHGAYAANIAELSGDFTFAEKGKVEIVSADAKCYQSRATHECLIEPVLWDSCKSGLQQGRMSLFEELP
ncbi:MAG: hypothetical protein HZA04_01565 [Nitrospinae bacterium]|nr:hypothetical protein [Nitrospinota bacterium]